MSNHVKSSAILPCNIDKAWGLIRPLSFVWWPHVYNIVSDSKESTAMAVGNTYTVYYNDYTTQKIRISELSDTNHYISWDVIESNPTVKYSGATHTISLLPVTQDNTTFIEFHVTFDRDASNEVLADAKYKQKDQIAGLTHEANKQFNYFSTAFEVAKAYAENVKGKVFIVTGCNIGLGLETCRALVANGGHVIGTCREEKKCKDTSDAIKKEFSSGKFDTLVMDLNSLKSVKAAAETFRKMKLPLHGLICNAGVMACPFALTEEKLESQFGVNHMAHFLFVTELLDILKASAPSRVTVLSSYAHMYVKDVNIDDYNWSKNYEKWASYGSAKGCNVLFANHLNTLFEKEGVKCTANSLHPGAIVTNLGQHLSEEDRKRFTARPPRWKTIPQGASTTLVAALAPEFGTKGGFYLSDCGTFPPAKYTQNKSTAEKLWALSEKLVKELVK